MRLPRDTRTTPEGGAQIQIFESHKKSKMDLKSLWKCAVHIKMIRELITPDLKLNYTYVVNIERYFTMDQAEAVVDVLNNEIFRFELGRTRILSIWVETLGIHMAYCFRLRDASLLIIHKQLSYKQPSSREAALSMLSSPDFIDLLNEYFPLDRPNKDTAVLVMGRTSLGDLNVRTTSY